MRRVKRIIATISLLGLILIAVPAGAQSSAISGGNATDYQPPTGNPQNETRTNLQPTGTGLQPVPGQDNFTQQNLGGKSDLQVAGTNVTEPNTNTTSTEAPDVSDGINPLPMIIIGLLTLAAIAYVIVQPSDSSKKTAVSVQPAETLKPEPLPVKKKTPKKKSKSNSKKRKK